MSQNYEREESIRRAKGRLEGGYDAEYVYGRLLSEGFNEKEAADVLKNLTGKPFKASPSQASAPAEAPPVASFAGTVQESRPAKEPTLVSLASAAQESRPAEEPATLASLVNTAQESRPAEEPATLASLINTAQASPSENSAVEQPSEPVSPGTTAQAAQPQTSNSDFRRQKEATNMALQLLDGGYDSQYVYKKFIKEGYSHEEVTAILSRISSAGKQNTNAQPRATKTSEVHRREATQKAIALLDSGYKANFIYQRLLNEGYSQEIAQSVVLRTTGQQIAKPVGKSKNEPGTYQRTPYTPSQQQQYSDSGDQSGQVMIGVAMIVIGLGITFCSYQAAASNPGGGTYVVTFGLVIAGIFRVIKGLSQ
jgi:hypothetical protein